MSDQFEDLESWYLNLAKIVEDKDRSSITKMLALKLMTNPYLTVGSFLQNINDDDLDYILDLSEKMTENQDEEDFNPPEETQDLLLMTMMLANAEGSPASTMEDLQHHLSAFTLFVAGTSLHRKGFVEAFYGNMSFNEDMSDKPIFKKIDE